LRSSMKGIRGEEARTFFGAGVDDRVELAGDDFAEAVALEATGDPFGGDAEEGAGLDDEAGLEWW